jgi:hypothetical protein
MRGAIALSGRSFWILGASFVESRKATELTGSPNFFSGPLATRQGILAIVDRLALLKPAEPFECMNWNVARAGPRGATEDSFNGF